jgi:hypothetical protein
MADRRTEKDGTVLVEISREPPCPGRRGALLTVATQGSDAPGGAETLRHSARCARCHAYLETVRLELRLAADAMGELHDRFARRGAPPFDLAKPKSFDRWLDAELRVRSERDLARTLVRVARWLFRLDPDVAARTEVGEASQHGPEVEPGLGALPRFAAELTERLALRAQNHAAMKAPPRLRVARRDLVEWLSSFDERAAPDVRAREKVARQLLAQAQAITDGTCAEAWLVEALIEWFSGDAAKVAGLTERAEKHSDSVDGRACAFLNLGLLASDEGREAVRGAWLDRALAMAPSPPIEQTIRVNKLLWAVTTGRARGAELEVAALERSGRLALARRRHPPAGLRRVVDFLATRYGLAATRREQAARDAIGALHG